MLYHHHFRFALHTYTERRPYIHNTPVFIHSPILLVPELLDMSLFPSFCALSFFLKPRSNKANELSLLPLKSLLLFSLFNTFFLSFSTVYFYFPSLLCASFGCVCLSVDGAPLYFSTYFAWFFFEIPANCKVPRSIINGNNNSNNVKYRLQPVFFVRFFHTNCSPSFRQCKITLKINALPFRLYPDVFLWHGIDDFRAHLLFFFLVCSWPAFIFGHISAILMNFSTGSIPAISKENYIFLLCVNIYRRSESSDRNLINETKEMRAKTL